MSNIFTINSEHKNADEWLCMSNSYTTVIISTLVLSGSILETTDREKEIIVWLAQHDQGILGGGTVGFSIQDIPWTYDGFEREKTFLLQVVDGAINRLGWEKLGYSPGEHTIKFLYEFKNLIEKFDKDYVDDEVYKEWRSFAAEEYGEPMRFQRCTQDNTLLYWHGCIICGD